MLYSSFTPNHRFTKYLVDNKLFVDSPLVVVDVGARGGLEYHWADYKDAAQFIGFEPDKEECDRLNSIAKPNTNMRFYPVALFGDSEVHTFYHKDPAASSLYPSDLNIISRIPDEGALITRKTSTIRTIDFKSFVRDYSIADVDFMKLDAEGAELDILRGSIDQLKKSVIGISCEILFMPWLGEGRGLSEIEQLLRPLGFKLYDLNIYRYAKKAFPGIGSVSPSRSGVASYGQIGLGQAIFFRDPVDEIEHKKGLASEWDQVHILKAVSLFEVFGLPDCAIELLNVAEKHGLLVKSAKISPDKFRDLIVSGFLGRTTTYQQHLQKLAEIKRRGYVSWLEHITPALKKIPYLAKIRSLIKRWFAHRRNNYAL